MTGFWQRLRQRNLVQWAVACVAAAFALLQGIDIVAQQFGWPEELQRGITLAMVLGFFVVLVLSWYHGERGEQMVSSVELLILAAVRAVGGGLLWRFAPTPTVETGTSKPASGEVARASVLMAVILRYQQQVVTSGRRGLAYLASDADCVADCNALLVDFFHASQFWATPYSRAKYEEIQRLGLPSNPNTRLAANNFCSYIDGWDAVTAAAPAYRERVRRHIVPEAAEILWKGCWRPVDGQLEELTRDCEDELKSLDAAAMLRSIRQDVGIGEDLTFWIGQNIFAARAFPIGLGYANTAVTRISADVGNAP